jgi:hypothetical protein
MNSLLKALKSRFGQDKITTIPFRDECFYCIDLSKERNVTVIMTSRFNQYCMPIPEKLNGFEYGELYACLPAYWEVSDPNDETINWAFEWLYKIQNYTIDKQTWIGDGHTYDCTKYGEQLSRSIKQNYLFITSPIYLETELKPLQVDEKTIHFWGLIPIFSDEIDFKQSKGTVKFKNRLISKGVSEKIDEYRQTALKTRWVFFK